MFTEMMQMNGYKIFQTYNEGSANTTIAEEKPATVGLDISASVYLYKPLEYFALIGALDNKILTANQELIGI